MVNDRGFKNRRRIHPDLHGAVPSPWVWSASRSQWFSDRSRTRRENIQNGREAHGVGLARKMGK